MATTYLTRTNGSAATLGTKFTFSAWVKVAVDATTVDVLNQPETTHVFCMIEIKPQLDVQIKNGSGTTYTRRRTNRDLTDLSGWYNLVMTYDSTDVVAEDRLKIYVNGERQSSWTDQTGTIDSDMVIPITANTEDVRIGTNGAAAASFFNGCMSHIHFIDGLAYEASTFGSTDSDTGEWVINTTPTIADYGNNGFFILKNGNSVTDQSGKGNNLTVGGGTLTATEDCPDDVFATFNPLDVSEGTVTTFSNGNTTTMHNAGGNGATTAARSTLAYSKGKFYWEAKCIATGGDVRTGIISMSSSDYNTSSNPFTLNECYNYKQNGEKGSSGDTNVAYGDTYTADDIIGIAHDVAAGTLTFYLNGVSQGTAFTGLSTSITWGAFSTEYNQGKYSYNFGNGYFGTTIISSEGTNASGIGKFEYDVPAGFTALSTKGLNS